MYNIFMENKITKLISIFKLKNHVKINVMPQKNFANCEKNILFKNKYKINLENVLLLHIQNIIKISLSKILSLFLSFLFKVGS